MMEQRFGFSRKLPPAKCPDCGSRLVGQVRYGRTYYEYRLTSPSFVDGSTHWRPCTCGCVLKWSWPNVWVRRHVLPIFDTERLVVQEA